MDTSRRDFMKLFGIGVASLLLTRCRVFFPGQTITCYTPMPVVYPTGTPTPQPAWLDARGRLRVCWLRFGELAQKTSAGLNQGPDSWDNRLGDQMIADHRAALDELVAAGELSRPVADLVQEAYAAAVYHVWRSNVPITCYEPMLLDYAPASADTLVRQSEILSGLAGQGSIDPQTLAKAQAALEHDMAYYDLSEADLQALTTRLLQAAQDNGSAIPSFDSVPLDVSPDARAAADFIMALLAGK